MSALPYVFLWLLQLTSGLFTDRVLKKRFHFQTKTIRIIFNVIGFFGPMLAMIGLMFVTEELRVLGVVLIVIGSALLYFLILNTCKWFHLLYQYLINYLTKIEVALILLAIWLVLTTYAVLYLVLYIV